MAHGRADGPDAEDHGRGGHQKLPPVNPQKEKHQKHERRVGGRETGKVGIGRGPGAAASKAADPEARIDREQPEDEQQIKIVAGHIEIAVGAAEDNRIPCGKN